jgi:hypothetical protein
MFAQLGFERPIKQRLGERTMADISQFKIVGFQDAASCMWRASFRRKDGAAITFKGTTLENFITSADAPDEATAIDLAIKAIKAMS